MGGETRERQGRLAPGESGVNDKWNHRKAILWAV